MIINYGFTAIAVNEIHSIVPCIKAQWHKVDVQSSLITSQLLFKNIFFIKCAPIQTFAKSYNIVSNLRNIRVQKIGLRNGFFVRKFVTKVKHESFAITRSSFNLYCMLIHPSFAASWLDKEQMTIGILRNTSNCQIAKTILFSRSCDLNFFHQCTNS